MPPEAPSPYALRRPTRQDVPALRVLAADVRDPKRRDVYTDRWWWRDDEPHCWVAEHRETGDLAAICGSRRVRYRVGDRVCSAVSICDWYVSPHHTRQGLGRALVQKSMDDNDMMYTSAISESAAVGFARLGWEGDTRYPILLGAPALAGPVARLRSRRVETSVTRVSRDRPLSADLRDRLDDLYADLVDERPVGMVRDGRHVQGHLRLAGVDAGRTEYALLLAHRAGATRGYLLLRLTARGAIRSLPGARLALVSDFLTPPSDPAILRALLARAARVAFGRCELLVATASEPGDLRELDRLGFVSPRTPLVGRWLV